MYVFTNQVLAKAQIKDTYNSTITLQGISANETDADTVRDGIAKLLEIVGWDIKEAVRVVSQDIVEE